MRHVSSRSGVAILRTAIHLFLTYLRSDQHRLAQVRSRASAGFWLGGQCPLAAWGEKKLKIWLRNGTFWSIGDLNKYVVSIAPFSTPAFTPHQPPIRKLLFFACFRYLIFHPFSRGSLTPFAPVCGRPWVRLLLFCLSRTVLAKITNFCHRLFVGHCALAFVCK